MFGLAKVALDGRPPSVQGPRSQSIALRAIMERWTEFLSAEESAGPSHPAGAGGLSRGWLA
jgi:hypothetical protein